MKNDVYGDLTNVKGAVVKELKAIYDLRVPRDQITTAELDDVMLRLTAALGREFAL